MEQTLHEECEPLAFLLGTWRGQGQGRWGDGEPFSFGEETTFEHDGQAFLVYSQRSWRLETGAPSHHERGFVRPAGPGWVEIVLAHPLGVAEIAEGTLRGTTIDVASTSVTTSASGSPVTVLERHVEVRGDRLRYELRMAMRDVPLTQHLTAELARV